MPCEACAGGQLVSKHGYRSELRHTHSTSSPVHNPAINNLIYSTQSRCFFCALTLFAPTLVSSKFACELKGESGNLLPRQLNRIRLERKGMPSAKDIIFIM